MASKEATFPGPRCKNANISIEGLMDGDVSKLSFDDFSKGIFVRVKHRCTGSQLYTDNVRQCCLELLSMNVGILQVDPVIRSVLKNIAGMEIDKLPKPASLIRMLTELKCLSYQQIADELQGCENITLHADGTSKFGQHYGSSRSVQTTLLILWDYRKC